MEKGHAAKPASEESQRRGHWDLKKINTRVAELKKVFHNEKKIRLMFQDEAGFGRINKPKYCWCKLGSRPSVPCPIISGSTVMPTARWSRWPENHASWSCHIATQCVWMCFSKNCQSNILITWFCCAVMALPGINQNRSKYQKTLNYFTFLRIPRRWIQLSKFGKSFASWAFGMRYLPLWKRSSIGFVRASVGFPLPWSAASPVVIGSLLFLIRD